jgi:hypothetical protein
LQQTPSAQNLDAHSSFLLHTAPGGLGPQLLLTHSMPAAQLLPDAQVAKHLLLCGSQE